MDFVASGFSSSCGMIHNAHLKIALYSSPEENSDSFESQIVNSSPSDVGTTGEK